MNLIYKASLRHKSKNFKEKIDSQEKKLELLSLPNDTQQISQKNTLIGVARTPDSTFSEVHPVHHSPFDDTFHQLKEQFISLEIPPHWIAAFTALLLKIFIISGILLALYSISLKTVHYLKNRDSMSISPSKMAISMPQRPSKKLKNLFKNPLVTKQTDVYNALSRIKIESIQRSNDGSTSIMLNGKIYHPGALISEHPKIYFSKINGTFLEFKDKYQQIYSRPIDLMLQ